MTAVDHEFDRDTRVSPVAPHEYAATVTDRWNALGGPNGGYLVAICLQALRQTMPYPDPLAVSAFFLRSAAPGPAMLTTELARSGRRLATGAARLMQGDREVMRVIASFTDLARAEGRTLVFADKPVLPPSDEAIDLLSGRSMQPHRPRRVPPRHDARVGAGEAER